MTNIFSTSTTLPPFSTIHSFFPYSTFLNFEAVRILSTTPYGGCDPAEFLTAIAAINPRDPETWATAWSHAASLAERLAEEALSRGDTVAARDAFLRASSYTRASGYLRINGPTLDQHDPRALPIARNVQRLFRCAIPFFEGEVRVVEIPYRHDASSSPPSSSPSPSSSTSSNNTILLPGYLYLPAPQNRLLDGRVPLLINTGGADSVQEELYYLHPQAGLARGYAVLTFEGPGQGIVLRQHGLPMRPDWEAVTTQVLDWLPTYSTSLQHTDGFALDLSRIAIAGASMGGYYALRAACDPRIKAAVSIDPFYDMWDFGTEHVSPALISAWMNGWLRDAAIDTIVRAGMRWNFQLKWEVGLTSAFWGIDSPARIFREMKRYTLKDGWIRDKVKCPVFVSGAGKSLYFDTERHTDRVWEDLKGGGDDDDEGEVEEGGKGKGKGKNRLWVPSVPEEGGLQAKVGAWGLLNMKVFGFLDEVFEIQRVTVGAS